MSHIMLVPGMGTGGQEPSNVFEDIFIDPFDDSEATFDPLFTIDEVE